MGDMDINHVVERRGPARLSPDIVRQHLPGYGLATMAEQVIQQIEFARGKDDFLGSTHYTACLNIHDQIGELRWFCGTGPSRQGPDSGQQFGKAKGFTK